MVILVGGTQLPGFEPAWSLLRVPARMAVQPFGPWGPKLQKLCLLKAAQIAIPTLAFRCLERGAPSTEEKGAPWQIHRFPDTFQGAKPDGHRSYGGNGGGQESRPA